MALVRFILHVRSSRANRVSTHDITSPIHSVDFADHRGGGGRGREWTGGAGEGGALRSTAAYRTHSPSIGLYTTSLFDRQNSLVGTQRDRVLGAKLAVTLSAFALT